MAPWGTRGARRWLGAAGLGLVTGLGPATGCILNPQPEDPFGNEDNDDGTYAPSSGGRTTVGSAATGGSEIVIGAGGTTSGGGAAASGGAAPTAGEGECVARGEDAAIDDGTDCDAVIAVGDGRYGEWFAYDSGPELPGTQTPAADAFTMDEDPAQGCAVHVVGGGYSTDTDVGLGYAGVGVEFLEAADVRCADGYDAVVYTGLGFVARGTGSLRILVETVDTTLEAGRPNGYALEIPLGEDWAPVEVEWSDLVLLAVQDGAPVAIDPGSIVTLRFEPVDPSSYDFWIDDLAFLVAPGGVGGEGGAAGGEGGAAGARAADGSPGASTQAGAASGP